MVGIIVGLVVSRAINGGARLSPDVARRCRTGGCASIAGRADVSIYRFATWINGRSRVLVQDGEIDWDSMKKSELEENVPGMVARR